MTSRSGLEVRPFQLGSVLVARAKLASARKGFPFPRRVDRATRPSSERPDAFRFVAFVHQVSPTTSRCQSVAYERGAIVNDAANQPDLSDLFTSL
jgi:hypothetical protein